MLDGITRVLTGNPNKKRTRLHPSAVEDGFHGGKLTAGRDGFPVPAAVSIRKAARDIISPAGPVPFVEGVY